MATMNEVILRAAGRYVQRDPADLLQTLDEERGRAAEAGDEELVRLVDERIDAVVAEGRERASAERREVQEAFSGGVRRPLVRTPSQTERMDALLLAASGRTPNERRRR
jgi:hypothetical protein